jgi:hypothetical protein
MTYHHHNWSKKALDGLLSRICHDCNEFEIEVEVAELRAEVERLRHERRMFRRRIAECLPWVGRTPYPNTRHFDEMIACRDLAKDTLDEVPE